MNESNIKVSILCLAYNHAKYLRQTLEGFFAQKTNFDYEIIIHDDASTDETASVIREYAKKYPDVIRPVFQTENQYSKNVYIMAEYLNPLVRGKYVALCEGDDYWSDEEKLQRQYDIMEKNPDCSMCVHRIQQILEDGTPTEQFRPAVEMTERKIDTQQFLDMQKSYPFQTGCFFMRTELWIDLENNRPAFRNAADVGDEPALLYMAAHGNIYYLPYCMSVYRIFSVGSWSGSNKRALEKRCIHSKHVYEMMRLFDAYTNHQYDCHLSAYKGKMLWLSENYRELARKENRACMAQLSKKNQLFAYTCAVFPFVGRVRKIIIELIKVK